MERWSSRAGFLLAAVSAAVGLGNVWRFPSVAGANGGGAYLLPYFLAAFVFAVPLLVLEIAVGRTYRVDPVSAFRGLREEFALLGWVVVGAVVAILSYYLVLTGWVLAFLAAAVAGAPLTFGGFTATYWPVATYAVAALATAGVVSLGVRSGIERLATVVMPVVFAILVGLVAYGTSLDGFVPGVAFFVRLDAAALADPGVWSAAFGQVFFSLSVGQGIMLTYGSYLDEGVDVVRSSLLITVADLSVAVLAALVVFPVVFTFEGLSPTAGTELAFTTLPRAFEMMRFGRVVAVAFFGLLFFAALTSAVSMLEVGVASVRQQTGLGRGAATAATAGAVFVLGLFSALSYSAAGLQVAGTPVLDVLDETVGAYALPVSAVLVAVAFTWFQPREVVLDQFGGVRALVPLTKYVVPVALGGVVALRLFTGGRGLLPAVDAPAWLRDLGVVAFLLVVLGAIAAAALRAYAGPERSGRSRRRRR